MTPLRRRSVIAHALLGLLIYPALLLTKRGLVVADTKQYLTLDPGTMLQASTSLWDPDWALGTVTHQSIGYLWPMAPWMRLGELLGLPVWATQRLWLATIVFAATTGMLFLGRILRWSAAASFGAGAFYALSPYPLAYATRMSALIMPWAVFRRLLGFAILALRQANTSRHGRIGDSDSSQPPLAPSMRRR
ncbi:MAG: alpha-(1-_3)-arabinofuranosyltransferase family protein [Acidimicrobiales bacterium]